MRNDLPKPEFKLNGKTIARLLDADHVELLLPDSRTKVVPTRVWAEIIASFIFWRESGDEVHSNEGRI